MINEETAVEKEYLDYQHLVPKTLQRLLINPNAVAKKHGMEYEDFVQIGNLGLCQAIKKYNKDLSKKETYYINMIRWSVLNFMNSYNEIPTSSLDKVVSIESENDGTLHDIIKGDEIGDEEVFSISLDILLSNMKLKKREKEMVYLRVIKGLTYSEIAAKTGVSPQRVNQVIKYNKNIFKNMLTD